MIAEQLPVTGSSVRIAADAVAGGVVRTPMARSETLSAITGTRVWVKFENLQFTGSYKERGALNKLLSLSDEARASGVVAASAGNFAQAVAHHARRLGIAATIVMPVHTPNIKLEGTRALGARVVLDGEGFDDANRRARSLGHDEGMTYLAPFDDPAVISGQGTLAIELLHDAPDVDVLVVPVGGGGLLAGVAALVKEVRPDVELIGVQSERYPSMVNAVKGTGGACGGPTIAEGIAVVEPGVVTRRVIAALVDDLVTVPEPRIEEAILLYLDVEKTVAEGAGAAGLAAVLEYPERFRDRTVGLVVTGGNIDLLLLASVITRGMIRSRRLVALTVDLPDTPGSLSTLTRLIADAGVNIVDVDHRRHRLEIPTRVASVTLTVETRGPDHADALLAQLAAAGYRWTSDGLAGHIL